MEMGVKNINECQLISFRQQYVKNLSDIFLYPPSGLYKGNTT